jgi:hypothetical protein
MSSRYKTLPEFKARIDKSNAKYNAKTKEERALKQVIYRSKPEVKARYAANRKIYYQNNRDKFLKNQKEKYYPTYKQNIELDDIIEHEQLIKTDKEALTTEFMLKLVLEPRVCV